MKWMRGRALVTLLALRGWRSGDEVMTTAWLDSKPKKKPRITRVVDPADCTIVVGDHDGIPVRCACEGSCKLNVYVRPENITAWRRPKK